MLYRFFFAVDMNPVHYHVDAGRFDGCPPSWDSLPSQTTLMASAGATAAGSN